MNNAVVVWDLKRKESICDWSYFFLNLCTNGIARNRNAATCRVLVFSGSCVNVALAAPGKRAFFWNKNCIPGTLGCTDFETGETNVWKDCWQRPISAESAGYCRSAELGHSYGSSNDQSEKKCDLTKEEYKNHE